MEACSYKLAVDQNYKVFGEGGGGGTTALWLPMPLKGLLYSLGLLPSLSCVLLYKARQTRFIVSHQRPLPLRPAASTARHYRLPSSDMPTFMAITP